MHVEPASLPEWVALLRQSDVRWLRERNVWVGADFDAGIRERLTVLHEAGFSLVAFAGTPSTVTAQREENQLPEDLLAVYASGYRQGREYAGLVSAWELSGEPDVGYCRDLPDRLAAYNKAMYLGLKSGAEDAFQASLREKVKLKEGGGAEAESLELRAESGAAPLSLRSEFKLKDAKTEGSELNLKLPTSTHDGRTPIVLMGALALPPGPWWERAVDNGLLDYTDAYNFHFYGNAEDLTSVIGAHRSALRASLREKVKLKAMGRPAERSGYQGTGTCRSPLAFRLGQRNALPLWLTECGVNATVPGDYLNAERREFQAEFTRATARQALAAREVAMFMPFILVHRDDPHAMALPSPPKALPAWDAYAKLTRETEWPERSLSSKFKVRDGVAEKANPVVVQWMPAQGTETHKVAGTYRLRTCDVMSGEFRIYNFGDRPVAGVLGADELRAGSLESRAGGTEKRSAEAGMLEAGLCFLTPEGRRGRVTLSIPAGGCVTVPALYKPEHDTGYFREWIRVGFEEARGEGREARAMESRVAFGVERRPEAFDFTAEPVEVYPLRGDGRLSPPVVNAEGAPSGPWRVFNGLEVKGFEQRAGSHEPEGRGWMFSMGRANEDPLAPAYAMAALRGVPKDARFLRLRLDRPMSRTETVRVDLVDTDGERFTIWENLGNAYGQTSRDVWLALADFHPYFWSKALAGNRRLRPDKVREIRLRFTLPEAKPMTVELEWMSPQ